MQQNQYGFIAFYGAERLEIYAPSLYAAKQEAVRLFKVRKKQEHLVSVTLAEKDGETVTHSGAELG